MTDDVRETIYRQIMAYVEEARKLYALKPDHYLLKYALNQDDGAVWEEFLEYFGLPGASQKNKESAAGLAYAYAAYREVLVAACSAPERVFIITNAVFTMESPSMLQ